MFLMHFPKTIVFTDLIIIVFVITITKEQVISLVIESVVVTTLVLIEEGGSCVDNYRFISIGDGCMIIVVKTDDNRILRRPLICGRIGRIGYSLNGKPKVSSVVPSVDEVS